MFAENFSKNSNLDDLGISLPVFLSKTNLKLHNISVTPKMVKKIIMNLDLSKASGPDCIPVVVLRNCESELSYILAELFSKCLKESCFPVCWKVSSVVPVFKACVHYFSLFLKEQYVSWLFQTKYFEIKFNLQLLYLPNISRASTCCPPS